MTIMFSDVRGFTTISESYKHDPQGLTSLMNRFLTPLTNAILDRKGTIDKYMGDAIMAFWSAPIEDPRHELNACEAALDMLDRVDNLNREREQAAKENNPLPTFISAAKEQVGYLQKLVKSQQDLLEYIRFQPIELVV